MFVASESVKAYSSLLVLVPLLIVLLVVILHTTCTIRWNYFVDLVSGLILLKCIPGLSLLAIFWVTLSVLCRFTFVTLKFTLDLICFPAHICPMSSCATCMAVSSEGWATFRGVEETTVSAFTPIVLSNCIYILTNLWGLQCLQASLPNQDCFIFAAFL